MDFGFIGFGSMAKMLIDRLINYSKIEPSNIHVTRKDKSKLKDINDIFAGVYVYKDSAELVKSTNIVFLCVKPAEIKNILLEIKPFVNSNTHIISLAGTVTIENIQSVFNGKISKFMPTITSQIGEGISLMCHNESVKDSDIEFLEKYVGTLGKIKVLRDCDIGFAAELTSCMPGFIASIFSNFANAASLHTSSFNKQEVNEMIIQTLYATSKLLMKTDMTFEQIITRVATKGGITQEGVNVFNEELPKIFDEIFKKTLDKRRFIEEKVTTDFENTLLG